MEIPLFQTSANIGVLARLIGGIGAQLYGVSSFTAKTFRDLKNLFMSGSCGDTSFNSWHILINYELQITKEKLFSGKRSSKVLEGALNNQCLVGKSFPSFRLLLEQMVAGGLLMGKKALSGYFDALFGSAAAPLFTDSGFSWHSV